MIERILVYKELLEDEIIRDSVSYLFNKDDIFLHGLIRRIYSVIGVQQNAFERYIFDRL